MLKLKLFSVLFILTILGLLGSCKTGDSQVTVIPGKSIAGIELGMHRKDVIALLGQPSKELSQEDVGESIHPYFLGKEKFINAPLPRFTVLLYPKPYLSIFLYENDTIGAVQLGYTPNVHVEGYDFLKFEYLSQNEINLIGKPSSTIRDKKSETVMIKNAPRGTKLEYYVYGYEQPNLVLGLIFDRTKQKSSEKFIAVNYITIKSDKIISIPE